MNKKGFTLIEVLAVVAIIGILGGVAVREVGKYIYDSRTQAYDTIMTSSYDAAVSYYLDNSIEGQVTITLEELVDLKYLEEPFDPKKEGTLCYKGSNSSNVSSVKITGGENPTFLVKLYCPSGFNSSKTYRLDN